MHVSVLLLVPSLHSYMHLASSGKIANRLLKHFFYMSVMCKNTHALCE